MIDKHRRIQIYRNLQKECFSIMQDGVVVDYRLEISITSARFNVQPAGREKVRKSKVKNVHAMVTGYLEDLYPWTLSKFNHAIYNPYKHDTFVDEETKEPVYSSYVAVLYFDNGRARIAYK